MSCGSDEADRGESDARPDAIRSSATRWDSSRQPAWRGASTRLIAHPKLFVEIPRPFSIRHRVSDDVESFDLSSIDVVKVTGKNHLGAVGFAEV